MPAAGTTRKRPLTIRGLVTALAVVISVLGLSAARAEPVTISNVSIEMSDGTVLVGDVSLPDASGQFPAILVMTPYGPATYVTRYLNQGYAHVNVDIRGAGRSSGVICFFCDREQQDVYEVVEWIAAQPWSNQSVGMMGGSYLGITALVGAAKQPPHLKAIVPIAAYADAYREAVWHNGMLSLNFMTQWSALQPTLSSTGVSANPGIADRIYNPIALRFARDNPFDGPVWWERAVYTKYDRITVPTLLLSGWFDGFSRGNVWNFQGISATNKRLIMGPGTHKNWDGAMSPFDPASPYTQAGRPPGNPTDVTLAWFDRFLKGTSNGIENGPRVQYFDLGSSQWKTSDTWPPTGSATRRFYLSGAPSGSTNSLNDGSLTDTLPEGAAAAVDRYFYDPAVGTGETFSKWGTLALTPHIRLDQRADQAHALTYTTQPLAAPLTLAGPIELHLWAQTDASDTDWVVKVNDVAPDGSSMLITSGFMRATHREWDPARSDSGAPWINNTAPSPVVRFVPLEYRIDVWDTAYQVQPGHRLRIMVGSSDTPSHEALLEPALNAVFHDATHSSELVVTVL